MKISRIVISTVFALLFLGDSYADTNEEFLFKKQNEILKELRCLSCEGQSILGSNSRFAKSIKYFVKKKTFEGKSRDEIMNLLRIKYGDEIMFDPPFKNSTFALWLLPFIVIAIASFMVVVNIKKQKLVRADN